MDVAVERPPVKEEKRGDAKPEIISKIGSALPIVFESFQSPQMTASIKQEDSSRMEAAKAEMGEVREENERLKTMLSRIVSDYKTLQMHFLDVVKVREQAAIKATKLLPAEPAAPAAPPPVVDADDDPDDLVSLSLGTRTRGSARRKGHEGSSSSSGTADDSQLSLGLGFSRPSTDDDKASGGASAGPVLNLSSDSSSADDATKPPQTDACRPGESRKSPSGGAGDGADDEVQQQAKKTRVSVRVKCDTPTMNDGCQWRKYGQKTSKGNPCPRAYYRCTVAPNCPVRKQVQRCAEDRSILITTYEGTHNHHLPPAATAMASTTSAAAAMLTTGSTTSTPASMVGRHYLPLASAAGLLGPTTMVSTAASSCPTVTLDLTVPAANPHSLMHSSPYAAAAAGYESVALPAAWSSGYPAYGGSQPASYFTAKGSPATGNPFPGLGVSSRPDQLYGQPSYLLQRSTSSLGVGGQSAAVSPVVTDTLAKAITSDPSFQSVLAAVITSYMSRGGGTAQK